MRTSRSLSLVKWTRNASRIPVAASVEETNGEESFPLPAAVVKRRQRPRSVQLPTVQLPSLLLHALERVLSNYPRKSLTTDGGVLMKYLVNRRPLNTSEDSRVRKSQAPPINWDNKSPLQSIETSLRYGRRESIAFAASRAQACYGTTLRVLNEIARIDPNFKPGTMLDFGSGLGTAVWAANEVWNESLYEFQTVDISNEMGELASFLRRGGKDGDSGDKECIQGVHFKQYLPLSNKIRYDIVVAAYALSELSTISKLKQTIASLWRKTDGYIVLIEQGTLRGFDSISRARDSILKSTEWEADHTSTDTRSLEGHVIAPCPHDLECPVVTRGMFPCKFAQNVNLSIAQLNTAFRHRGIYTEYFSYVVIKKGPRPVCNETTPPSRLILPVRKRTRHAICSVCCPNGKFCEVILTKTKDKELYRDVRKMKWGDSVPLEANKYEGRSQEEEKQLEDKSVL